MDLITLSTNFEIKLRLEIVLKENGVSASNVGFLSLG